MCSPRWPRSLSEHRRRFRPAPATTTRVRAPPHTHAARWRTARQEGVSARWRCIRRFGSHCRAGPICTTRTPTPCAPTPMRPPPSSARICSSSCRAQHIVTGTAVTHSSYVTALPSAPFWPGRGPVQVQTGPVQVGGVRVCGWVSASQLRTMVKRCPLITFLPLNHTCGRAHYAWGGRNAQLGVR